MRLCACELYKYLMIIRYDNWYCNRISGYIFCSARDLHKYKFQVDWNEGIMRAKNADQNLDNQIWLGFVL